MTFKLPTLRLTEWKAVLLRFLFVLVLFSITRILFYFMNASLFGDLSLSEWQLLLLGGVRFDIVAALYLNLVYILFGVTALASNRIIGKILDIIFVVTNSLGLFLNCTDMAYYPFNFKRVTWTSFGELAGFNNAGDLVTSFLIRYWYIWVIWLLLTFALVLIAKHVKPSSKKQSVHAYVDIVIVTVIIALFGFRGNLRYSTRPLGLNDAGKYVKSPQNVALVFSTPFSIIRTKREQKISPYTYFSDEKEMEQYYNPVQKIETNEEFRKINVVFLVLESFGEGVSSIGNPDPTTNKFMPFLDSLRRHSFYSEYSFANGKKSIDALPSIWGSIPSYTMPYVLSKYASNKIYGLPHILREKGYHTSFFHGAPNGSMGFESFSQLMGIEHYYGKDEFNDNSQFDGIWGIWDQPFLQYYAKTLKTLPQPFFSTLFTVSSHDPFKVPKGMENKYPAGPHPYYKTVAYSDDGLRKFFNSIKNEPWFKNTLFVISADHTNAKVTSPEFLNSFGSFRIPLFFYAPGLNISRKSERVFQQTDIMPTVLNILRFDQPFISFGKDLLNENSKDFAVNKFENYQYIYGEYLLKLNADNKAVELYKYKTDKLLTDNIINRENAKADSLEKLFKAYIQQFQNRMIEDRFIVK